MITPGTVLIEKDTLCPEFFHLVDGSYPNGLMSFTHSLPPYELESELSRAGWTFSYIPGAIHTTAFGFNRSKMLDAALRRITVQVRQHRCNCLEIDGVETHSFLGLPYMSVSAHARRIQKGLVFSPQEDGERATNLGTAETAQGNQDTHQGGPPPILLYVSNKQGDKCCNALTIDGLADMSVRLAPCVLKLL